MEGIIHELIELRDLLGEHPLFTMGLLLIAGYYIGRLAALVKLPEITGFIIAGLLLGETVTGVVPHHMEGSLKVVTDVALGFIAITIGGEFYWVKLKRMGKEVVLITVVQIGLTFVVVTVALFVMRMELPFALMLGAIATATAPAATVAIVQSLRAHGKFVDYLYGVVALDDAGCVVVFGVVFAIATSILGGGGGEGHGFHIVLEAFSEVFFSLVIGVIAGGLIHILAFRRKNSNEVLITTIGVVFLATSVSIIFHLSPLLMNMAAGAVIINLSPHNHRIFRILEPLTPPIYALFFVIAGTELSPQILLQGEILLFGVAYILFRALGKYSGVYLGCRWSGVENPIRKNLGLCMFPQAGVAIGLVLLIQASPMLPTLSTAHQVVIDNMVNIVLLSVFVNELVGPPLSKYAVVKGNEMED